MAFNFSLLDILNDAIESKICGAYGKNRRGPRTDPCGKPKKSTISVHLSALPLSGSPRTVALSDKVQAPDLSTIISQVRTDTSPVTT